MAFLMTLLFCSSLFLLLFRRLLSARSSPTHVPETYPIIGSLLAFYKNRRRLLHWYTDLIAASPTQTIVMDRLGAGRRTVVTANPTNVEHILCTNFPNYPKGKPFTDLLGDLLGSGIFNADGDLWHSQRKLASHEFTTSSLRSFLVHVLRHETRHRLLPILSSSRPDVVDLQDLLSRFAFDTICMVSLGTDPGYLHPSLPFSGLADAFDVASRISAMRSTEPVHAVWKVKRALGVGSEARLRAAVSTVHDSIASIIRQRKVDGYKSMVSRLIAAGQSDAEIRDMVISFVMGGKDTTSSALTWFFWLVSSHPDIEAEVAEEVSRPAALVDYELLKGMKLLEACLYESMRLYPPVAWDSKHAAGDDVLPDGTVVRKGDRVTYFPYGMGRMGGLWGEDVMEFRPRRWMVGKEVARVSTYKFAVFQAGPRVCLGKEMAFVQMKYVAAAVLSRFRLRRVDRAPPVMVPLLTAHMA